MDMKTALNETRDILNEERGKGTQHLKAGIVNRISLMPLVTC